MRHKCKGDLGCCRIRNLNSRVAGSLSDGRAIQVTTFGQLGISNLNSRVAGSLSDGRTGSWGFGENAQSRIRRRS